MPTPDPQPYAWGAFDYCVVNKTTKACDPLDLNKTYRVGTNEFLAPAGGDGYGGFKYMTNITYWGDMLNAVNAWVISALMAPRQPPTRAPMAMARLDGRIVRDGDDTDAAASSRSPSCTTTTRTATWPRAASLAIPSWPP